MQQNHIDFSKSFGKIRFQIEMKQSLKVKTEFLFCMKFLEGRNLVPAFDYNPVEPSFLTPLNGHHTNGSFSSTSSGPMLLQNASTYQPFVEVFLLGPYNERKWRRKLVKYSEIDPVTKNVLFKDMPFEFRINVSAPELREMNSERFLNNYELQIVLSDSNCPKQFKINGCAVLNLNQVIKSAFVWKKLQLEDRSKSSETNHYSNLEKLDDSNGYNSIYACMELWIAMRQRLKVNDQGNKTLKVLERHATEDKRALEFIRLKFLSRHFNKILWN
jgi:hypothetical protein